MSQSATPPKRKRASKAKRAVPEVPAAVPGPPPVPQEPGSSRFTLEEAFDYFEIPEGDRNPSDSPRNVERAIRSVAFLLEWLSQHGNEPVDGFTAHGLAEILGRCARRVAP